MRSLASFFWRFPPSPLPFLVGEFGMIRRLTRAGASALLAFGGVAAAVGLTRGAEQPAYTLRSAATDSVILKGLRWRSLGPEHSGRSIAISGVKGQPKVGYFGATGGGLWKTTDGGERWTNVTDGQIKSSSVGAVAISETDPNIVFIGMGESCIRGDVQPGDGVYKSTDAG